MTLNKLLLNIELFHRKTPKTPKTLKILMRPLFKPREKHRFSAVGEGLRPEENIEAADQCWRIGG